ncbi:MAG: hypothetical protein B6241_03925 [Spirochaetaceae bacterium 4572_59]|nr:MAG: hypothetical protein B6241_03925 [Spirochaetaceae bacterium 4572_59]
MKKMLCSVIIISTALISLFSAEVEKNDAWNLTLQSAEDHFHAGIDGQKDELLYALKDYQKAMDQGAPEDYRIFYNWANTLMLAGYRGEAALMYRKVLYYKPANSNASLNLSLIEKDNPIEAENQGYIRIILFGILYLIGYEPSLYLGLFLFVFVWFLLILDLFLKKKSLHKLFVLLLILSLWDLSLCLVWNRTTAKSAVLVTEQSSLRRGDSHAYEAVHSFDLPAGTSLRFLEERGDWIRVRLRDGSEGWLERSDTKMVLEDY